MVFYKTWILSRLFGSTPMKTMTNENEPPKDKDKHTEFLLIGACLPRTGTTSLKHALSILLGGDVAHMHDLMTGKIHRREQVLLYGPQSTDEQFKEILLKRGFVGGVDAPFCFHIERALRVFPNAKVLLTTRDLAKWKESVYATVYTVLRSMKSFPHNLLTKYVFFPYMGLSGTELDRFYHAADAGQLDAFYHSYQENIRALVAADRLLVYEVKQGWQPLCDFLGVKKPDVPFPHINDKEHFQARFKNMNKWNIFMSLVVYALLASILIFCYWLIFW